MFFVRAITRRHCQHGVPWRGKNDGCGTPEGLPLICRFSPAGPLAGLASSCDEEPSSSSTWKSDPSPCAVFPREMLLIPPLLCKCFSHYTVKRTPAVRRVSFLLCPES